MNCYSFDPCWQPPNPCDTGAGQSPCSSDATWFWMVAAAVGVVLVIARTK